MRRGERLDIVDDTGAVQSLRSSHLARLPPRLHGIPTMATALVLAVTVLAHLLTPSGANAAGSDSGPDATLAALGTAAASATACDGYLFVGARGSGELDLGPADVHLGMGAIVYDAFASFAHTMVDAGQEVAAVGLDYPAVAMSSIDGVNAISGSRDSYDQSVAEGGLALRDLIRDRQDDCPETKIVLAGYSQGADALAAGIELLTPEESGMIVSTTLFGDPRFNAADTGAARGLFDPNHYGAFGPRSAWDTLLDSPVESYCLTGDAICGLSSRIEDAAEATFSPDFLYIAAIAAFQYGANITGAHESYVTSGDTARAGTRLATTLAGVSPTEERTTELTSALAEPTALF